MQYLKKVKCVIGILWENWIVDLDMKKNDPDRLKLFRFLKEREKKNNTWQELAQNNPQFYSLTSDKTDSNWQGQEPTFLETGEIQWERIKKFIANNGFSFEKYTAVDYGCGTGRITFAMAKDFKNVYGCDIADMYLYDAENNKKNLGIENVEFGKDIKFHALNLFFSYLVFQHFKNQDRIFYILKEMRYFIGFDLFVFQLRVAPTLWKYLKSNFIIWFKTKIPCCGECFDVRECEKDFLGTWVYQRSLVRFLKNNFKQFKIVVCPPEIYPNYKDIKTQDSRCKRTWVIAKK